MTATAKKQEMQKCHRCGTECANYLDFCPNCNIILYPPIAPMISAAFALDDLSLQWKAEFEALDAVEFGRSAIPHGNMEQKELIDAIRAINEIMPRMQFAPGNSNNGRHAHKFVIGREYKRVLYVTVAKRSAPKDTDYNAITAKLKTISLAEEADLKQEDDLWYEFRICWV